MTDDKFTARAKQYTEAIRQNIEYLAVEMETNRIADAVWTARNLQANISDLQEALIMLKARKYVQKYGPEAEENAEEISIEELLEMEE